MIYGHINVSNLWQLYNFVTYKYFYKYVFNDDDDDDSSNNNKIGDKVFVAPARFSIN